MSVDSRVLVGSITVAVGEEGPGVSVGGTCPVGIGVGSEPRVDVEVAVLLSQLGSLVGVGVPGS